MSVAGRWHSYLENHVSLTLRKNLKRRRCAPSTCESGRVAVWREQVVRVMEADAQEAKAEANARQKERVAAILAGTDAAGAGAGVEEALNCWEEGAYEAETLETLAEFGD
ncbi:hypothetical protein EMIHUDRAFT_195880 [Emiliania huxleyi CCMP1516]|uniref:Uncharacterized protein n=2 Tax=Emiliania huxleyi TaxID=2903 RepID=A0A0D3J328_EMIH1|nr:hypothetical protein EMIHUDRAFT_195880 [Emiliania huxleyi CCMP1516]EOD17913.1 hypothetical protein EMIHUDRAFT_195880 [Emiliania huxleyi CCMP1516]|eukprot:XP_005770342.1 hypothetical protein EMIHUDRAFT_195880 [Emiliania huxleyi CCMP1516]